MKLAAYLARIGYDGPVRPDLETLRAVHRAHSLAIPYENLDVQLGRPVTTDPAAAFDKIVDRGRGGWCYEMNGLLGWALGEIGFDITRMAGGVMRVARGEEMVGNHLILKVDLETGPWLADVGFGDGPIEPYPIAPGPFRNGLFDFRLETLPAEESSGWWRLHNHVAGGAPSFDFQLAPADEALLSRQCHWLQTSPESMFVQNATVQRQTREGLLILRGRVLRTIKVDEILDRTLDNADVYMALLKDGFGLDLPQARDLWPAIVARHEILFGTAQVSPG
jgi:N-hydroxyarylamine O-acetyltransferase